MSNNTNTSASFPLFSVVFVVFLVLKLTHVIDWSWWWVTAPLWGSLLLVVGIITTALALRR